jgi:hypothetical protein
MRGMMSVKFSCKLAQKWEKGISVLGNYVGKLCNCSALNELLVAL